tara:strand:+ start:270 stop:1241 length:972 start_codon:yes stop_codon:yes gene_type:complete
LELYLSGVLIYCFGIAFVRYFPYYENILKPETQQTLLGLYLTYLLFAPIIYLFFAKPNSVNKPFLLLTGSKKIFLRIFSKYLPQNNQPVKLLKKEKVAFLFLLVKIFYLPLMINFFYNNLNHLFYLYNQLSNPQLSLWYPLILTSIFALDTLIFALGYTFESKKLKNVVKSVEPTLFGWVVTIICYPPFNIWLGKYIPWGAHDHAIFPTPTITFIFRLIILLFLIIYLWATLALGFKASNLTNRGIVTKFPYSIVRHPAYICKNIIWWFTLLPVINWKFALGMSFWSLIYFFRITTEEKHLSKDPDYIIYKKKVKWRIIPKIY